MIILIDILKILFFSLGFVGIGSYYLNKDLDYGSVGKSFSLGVAIFILGAGFVILLPDGPFFKIYSLLFTSVGALSFLYKAFKKKSHFQLSFFLYIFVTLFYISGFIFEDTYQPWDDYLAYFPLARKLYEENSLFDPFFFRRVGALGGHTALHSALLNFFSEFKFNFLELGIFRFFFALTAFEFISKINFSSRIISFLIFLAFLFFDGPTLNIASYWTGATILLTILILLFADFASNEQSEKNKINIILLTSALVTLRPTYIFILPIIYMTFLSKEKKLFSNWKYLCLFVFFLAPWMYSSYNSSGTAFFPIFKGYFNEGYGTFTQHGASYSYLEIIFNTIYDDYIFYYLFLLFVSLMVNRTSYFHIILLTFPLVPIYINFKLPEAENPIHGIRYAFPFVVCGIFFATAFVCDSEKYRDFFKKYIKTISTLVVLLVISIFSISKLSQYWSQISYVKILIKNYDYIPLQNERSQIQKLQALVNADESIITAIDYPFLFNFNKSRIYLFDVPGQYAPPPGLPLGFSCREIDLYLKKYKVEYILFVDPQKSQVEYSEKFWIKMYQVDVLQKTGIDKYHVLLSKNLAGEPPKKIPSYFANWIKPHLQFIDYLKCKKELGFVKKEGNYYLSKIQ